MAIAFKLYYVVVLLVRARTEVLERERASTWVRELIAADAAESRQA
jgi:heme exporter protein C